MNGAHDMGGMHGFGPVAVEADTPFHDDLDRTIFGLHMLMQAHGVYDLDELRYARERMPPAEYLRAGYWERDLVAIETLLVENGYVSRAEMDEWLAGFDGTVPEVEDADLRAVGRDKFERDRISAVEPVEPAFDVGDRVRVRNVHPAGHTRAPRYARDKVGTVRKHYGTFNLPDAGAEGREVPEPCYSVVFEAAELWGADTDADQLGLDLWESYLEPA